MSFAVAEPRIPVVKFGNLCDFLGLYPFIDAGVMPDCFDAKLTQPGLVAGGKDEKTLFLYLIKV